MARATRSTTQHEKDKPPEPAPPTRKPASKKRKRTSFTDVPDQPVVKHLRTDDPVKEEGSQEPDDIPPASTSPPPPPLDISSTGDLPIQLDYATKILDILEAIDTQGLLDRVFPLPTEQEDVAVSNSTPCSYSFRSLLKEPLQYPLRVLRAAVHHLFPISSHPRSRPSAPAAEQLRFCNLALSLLDQASLYSRTGPLELQSIFALPESTDVEAEQTTHARPTRKRKYALVQRLTSGDWWSSSNSNFLSSSQDGRDITDLPTAHADLVAIFPTPSSGIAEPKTLAAYAQKRHPVEPHLLPQPRQICCGTFLNYGPYASFAPTFDQTGVEVGRVGLGEVIFQRERRKRLRALQDCVREKQRAEDNASVRDFVAQIADEPPGSDTARTDGLTGVGNHDNYDDFGELLSPEQVVSLKSTLGCLALEPAVDELLARNANALRRLGELQQERLGDEDGGSSRVKVDSEEWETAQNILESLAVLASLRPRSSLDDPTHPRLIPSAAALRRLHHTLPIGDAGGWYGTLPPSRASALRDDTTVRIKPGSVATVSAPAVAPTTPAASKVTTPATPQANYTYPSFTTQYRGNYNAHSQPTNAQHYPNHYQATPQQSSTHYPNAQYNGTGQHQYNYAGSWYNYPPSTTTQVSGGGTSSGRATPQPATGTGNYTFYNSIPQHGQSQRVVANTVLSAAASKSYQQGQWQNGITANTQIAPTLPSHLRSAHSGGTAPSTPVGTAHQNYYPTAQGTPSR